MAVQAECLSLIIPIWRVVRALGLTNTFSLLHLDGGDPLLVHDDHLLRFGAMNQETLQSMLSYWEHAGLRVTRRRNGVKEWADVCIVDQFAGPTLPCPWLAWDAESRTVEYVDDRSAVREVEPSENENYAYEGMNGAEIAVDFNQVFDFLEQTSSQVTWKWRGTLDDISQRMQNLPSVPSKYAVLKMTLPPTITCGTVHTLAELCQRISGADCGVSLGVRFHRNPSLEVAFTQFI